MFPVCSLFDRRYKSKSQTYHVHNHHWQHTEGKSENIEEGEGDESPLRVQNVCRVAQHVGCEGDLRKKIMVELVGFGCKMLWAGHKKFVQ